MKKSLKDKIINSLKKDGLISEDQANRLLEGMRNKKDGDIVGAFAESGIVSEAEVLGAVSREMNLPLLDISRMSLDSQMVGLVPEKLLRGYHVIPLSLVGDELTLVVANPADVVVIDDIAAVTGRTIKLVLATRHDIEEALEGYFKGAEESLFAIINDKGSDGELEVIGKDKGIDVTEVTKESKTAPIVKMVDLMISEAMKRRSSDIHVEPQETVLKIRYRIDGELHDIFDLPKKNQNAIIARLKIMSNLDITETRVPQDGRFRVKLGLKEIDFRVSVLPTNFGNKVVLRALDKSSLSVGLEALGFLPGPLSDFKTAIARPFGIILVTGPTGSGKSTTLYSVLNQMNTPDKNIVTIENPVEYQVPGITQIAAHADIGLTFASGLRAILRQSPDVIMVGEIRDFETADIAIKASLTGQLVLSTLHTNDAIGSITRLTNMGVEPFLIASSLVMACAQRLLRSICKYCRVEDEIPPETLEKLRKEHSEVKNTDKFYKGRGCSKCNKTGYSGRLGTLETFLVTDELREMINRRESEENIRTYLKKKGMKTLRQNAITKWVKGITTLEEVLRTT